MDAESIEFLKSIRNDAVDLWNRIVQQLRDAGVEDPEGQEELTIAEEVEERAGTPIEPKPLNTTGLPVDDTFIKTTTVRRFDSLTAVAKYLKSAGTSTGGDIGIATGLNSGHVTRLLVNYRDWFSLDKNGYTLTEAGAAVFKAAKAIRSAINPKAKEIA